MPVRISRDSVFFPFFFLLFLFLFLFPSSCSFSSSLSFFLHSSSSFLLFSCSLVLLFSCSLVLLFSCSLVLLFSCSRVLFFSFSLFLFLSFCKTETLFTDVHTQVHHYDTRRLDQTLTTNHTKGWRSVHGAILPGHRRAHWWVLARTPTVHQCPQSGEAVGGPKRTTRRSKTRGLPSSMVQAEQQAGAEQDHQVLQGTGREVPGAGELRIEEVSWRVDQRQGFRER